ncbi:hypothetical protein O59_000360 [Cellvibrio sp. BR]|nr:hypothetical protein O59_000360 [Cellvibrio sp. BR]
MLLQNIRTPVVGYECTEHYRAAQVAPVIPFLLPAGDPE